MLNAFDLTTCFAINPNIMQTPIGEETVLMNPEHETLYGVNHVGSEILKQLTSEPKSLQTIHEYLFQYYDVNKEQGQADIDDFLKSLLSEKLIIIVHTHAN
jgi:hypothetical protein